MNETLVLGIDVGGTNTAFGIVNGDGKILRQGKIATTDHATPEDFVMAIRDGLLPFFSELGKENIIGAGIGAPNGNFYSGKIEFAPNLPWKGVIPLAQLVEDALGMTTTLTNDAKAAAIGEMKYGAAKEMKDFIMVTLGTGLGSGFVSSGKLIYGHDGLAGELGHTIAVREGRLCNCGRKGCLERYASATGIVITAHEWLQDASRLTSLRGVTELTAKAIQDAAQAGDAFALELYEYTATILGHVLADMVAITSPEAIIFFGGLAHAGDMLLVPVKKHLEENLLAIYKGKVRILPSALPGADAAILGASALAW